MHHGKVSPQIAQGLKVLIGRIEESKIPSSKLDETINVATWNIREFGRQRNGRHRTDAAIHYIAEILGQFDLVSITELRDDLTDLERVMRILGPYWRVLFSDFNTDAGGNRERIGYLYDKRAVVPTGLAAEAEPPRKKINGEYVPAVTWWRSPYMASFRAGSFDFTLLTAHIRWGPNQANRIKELELMAQWVDDRLKEPHLEDKDLILMGDFNIPRVDDALFRAITSRGLELPDALRGTGHGSNLARDKRYDQILHHRQHTKTSPTFGGVLDYYQGDWRALFPTTEFSGMTLDDFTYEMSDHLPLWVQIDTDTEEEDLDQIIGKLVAPIRRRTKKLVPA